jgi:transcriptional regulator with XRE-family HTH domain
MAGCGLSLRQAAAKSGISPAFLSLLLKGERGVPAPDVVRQMERALGLNEGELFDAAGLADATTKTFLRKRQARPLMRSLERLTDEELAQVLQVADRLARKHHPDEP